MTAFYKKLTTRWKKTNSLVCIGLDPDIERIPSHLKDEKYPLFAFNRAIIDATHDCVCCYKPQAAYYSAIGAENELEMTLRYLASSYPDIPHILDAKRGDIGSTAAMYAKEAFDRYGADAVTINPFMGGDTLMPFLQRENKGCVILCKTSNMGSDEFQSLRPEGTPLYERIAHKAQHEWNDNGNVLLVVGATYPEEMAAIRAIAPDIPFLVPGMGHQGGNPEAVVRAGLMADGYGLIISSSRGIIHADSGPDFNEAAREETLRLKAKINRYRS